MIRALVALAIPTLAWASPVELTHQGRLLDAAGGALTGSRVVTIRLMDAPTDGAELWAEPSSVAFIDGYYTLALGAQPTNPLDSDDLAAGRAYLELQIDGETLGPRTRLSAVPYAAVAAVASEVEGGTLTGPIAIDGTLSASPPIADSDVATKGYVDGVVDAGTDELAASIETLLQRGIWRENCHENSTGWDSVSDCLHDGRWHQVAQIDPSGEYTQGSYAELRSLTLQSPDLRILVDDIQWHGYHLQFHAPATSGVDNSPAVWVRITPTPATYANASQEDFQDKMILFPASGKPEWGQNYYGDCGPGRTWANYGFFESAGCNIERMRRNNWEADINLPVKVYMRF